MRLFRLGILFGVTLTLAACPRDGNETPPPPATAELPECPTDVQVREARSIGPEGGTLEVAGHRLEVPPGAVAQQAEFSATLLADRRLKLDLRANQQESYAFAQPVALTLGLARCDPGLATERLRIYKIDPQTDSILREVGGEVNPRERTITARLDSLSVYTVGTF